MRKLIPLMAAAALLAGILFHSRAAAPLSAGYPSRRDSKVSTIEYEWHDAARNRDVPVKIYYPAFDRDAALCPVIIFSHGLGGSREGYEYLGRHWAEQGYVCVHLQHLGSDGGVLKSAHPLEALRQAAADPRNAINRAGDVKFAIDQVERLDRDGGTFSGHLDLKNIGMAGHSFGSWTTLAAIGQTFAPGAGQAANLADPRITAAIALCSPAPPKDDPAYLDAVYAAIHVPCFHITGTLDNSPIGDTNAAQRRIPYDHTKNAPAYLVTFKDGDHMVFSGLRRRGNGDRDNAIHQLTLEGTTAFWDCYLRYDAKARKWLEDGGFKASLGVGDVFEEKGMIAADGVSPAFSLP